MQITFSFLFILSSLFSQHALCAITKTEEVILENANIQNNIVTGNWLNHPGYLSGQRVVFTQLDRSVKTKGDIVIVELTYPQLPETVVKDYALAQQDRPLACKVDLSYLPSSALVKEVKMHTSHFRYPTASQGELDDVLGISSKHEICTIQISGIKRPEVINWQKAIKSGLNDLKLVSRKFVDKPFKDISSDYLDFLNGKSVSFKTDDEVWFLISSALHKEENLAKSFTTLDKGYIKNWVEKFVIYLTLNIDSDEFRNFVQPYFRGHSLESLMTPTYTISIDEEVIYEI